MPFRTIASVIDVTQGDEEQAVRILSELEPDNPVGSTDDLRPRLDCAERWMLGYVPAEDRTVVRTQPDSGLLAGLDDGIPGAELLCREGVLHRAVLAGLRDVLVTTHPIAYGDRPARLVVVDKRTGPGARTRYRMLETLRQYAAEQLPQGRLAIAVASSAVVRAIYEATVRYTKDRNAFGERIIDFQNSRFELADILTEVEVTETYVDQAIRAFNAGELDAASAARAKLWASERAKSVTDRCLQLHGGYGYILEYPVAQAFLAARLLTIFGGTNEIMRDVVGRTIAD